MADVTLRNQDCWGLVVLDNSFMLRSSSSDMHILKMQS